jgi:molybdenum cofactor cytidylyltransferase
MKFGAVPLAQALGAILAHSVDLPNGRLRKGQALEADNLAAMAAQGMEQVTVARLEEGDLHENAAARLIAEALVPDPEAAGVRLSTAFTGRVNLVATRPGVVQLDATRIRALNAVDPMITLATLPDFHQVGSGQMVGTVKIISYAVPQTHAEAAAEAARAAMRVEAVKLRNATLIITEIPGGPGEKGRAAIEARLAALGMELVQCQLVPHRTEALCEAIKSVMAQDTDLVLILTGSATSDAFDVAPEALRQAGGRIERFGMPVDPGNLLFLGEIGMRKVIGLPGCARSPALNGADWVLSRVAAGLEVSSDDIAAMGVGGLLKEIPTRPMPRAGRKRAASTAEVLGETSED